MTVVQERLMEMLSFFHDLCEKEGLRYYIGGGTALGAARHQGFIPWDDDIDVSMPRSDYEKLKKLSSDKLFEDYCFEYPSDKKDFVYTFAKMYDTRTTLIEHTRYKTKRGVYIDIFPLDGAGDTYEEAFDNFKRMNKKINLLSTITCGWRKGRKLYKNIAVIVMRCVPSFILNQNKLMNQIDEMAKKLDYDQCEYVINYSGNWYEKEILKREWLGKPTLCQFEKIQVYRPENIDAFLTGLYGDWRKLPPKEKQVSHHDYSFIDLETSYKQS